ncbi:hypothetical protein F2P79_020461 [Pimephales promelas]|nr:hypothetical protein F2P79_020461 [Pimephales promelas]
MSSLFPTTAMLMTQLQPDDPTGAPQLPGPTSGEEDQNQKTLPPSIRTAHGAAGSTIQTIERQSIEGMYRGQSLFRGFPVTSAFVGPSSAFPECISSSATAASSQTMKRRRREKRGMWEEEPRGNPASWK